MGGIPIRQKVLEYITQRPDQLLFVDSTANALGETDSRVRDCMRRIATFKILPGFKALGKGGPYKYTPERNNSTTYFEQIGKTKKGEIVLQDERGVLYKAKELE